MGQFNTVTFRINPASERAFADALKQLAYAKDKNMSDVANKKMFYVAKKAVWFTRTANYEAIAQAMGQKYEAAKGKRANSFTMNRNRKNLGTVSNSQSYNAPLSAILVNYFRGKMGLPGLRGAKLESERRKLVGLRLKSIGFLKAGWIAARDAMKRQAKIMSAPEGTAAGGTKRAGVARLGGAIAAKPDKNRAFAAIWNQASYGNKSNPNRGGERYKHDRALMRFGLPALERAFRDETADTMQELERTMKKSVQSLGIKVK